MIKTATGITGLSQIDSELERIEEYEAGKESTAAAYLGAMWRIDWLRERELAMKDAAPKDIMKIELWPIDKPIPYVRNARKISQSAIDKVAASIQEFGWQQPIVVDIDGVVVVGHVRLLAAKQLGEKKVPVHVARGLTPGQIKAFRLMDNRSHQESGWDVELLAPELAELQALNIDTSLTGFDAEEISQFLDPGSSDGKPPESFTEYDETIPTEHQCPKCGYTWSGAAAPKPEATEEAA